MAYGITEDGWVAAPTELRGSGAAMFGYDLADPVLSRAGVGGPAFPSDAGYDSTGFTRISTGPSDRPIPGHVAPRMTTWRSAFDWQDSPTFWVLLVALIGIGFIAFRVELAGSAGRLRAHAGVAV